MAVHHTAGQISANGDYAAKVRSTQAYHMDTRGWCDIGYHFLVTYDGTAWEGRPLDYRGAHVGDHNSGNVGISFVGCYHEDGNSSDPYCALMPPNEPSEIMISSGGELIGLVAEHFGFDVTDDTVKGHRDHSGASTSCPGSYLHPRLNDLRDVASGGSSSGGDPEPTPDSTGTVKGVVWDLSLAAAAGESDHARITDATVTCSCGESTAVSSSNAFWSFELPAGTYTFTASAPGFESFSAPVTVVAGQDVWSSFGLNPSEPDNGDPEAPEDPEDPPGAADAGTPAPSDFTADASVPTEDAGETTELNPDGDNTAVWEEDGDDTANGGVVDNVPLTNVNGEAELVLIPAAAEPESGCACSAGDQRSKELGPLGLLWVVFCGAGSDINKSLNSEAASTCK